MMELDEILVLGLLYLSVYPFSQNLTDSEYLLTILVFISFL